MMTSEELMQDYRESLSEEAFRELVNRYIDLVYTTALRRLNGDTYLAEDVAQMVFTDFALKVRTVPTIRLIGGWLHQHTCFIAAKTVRAETRRRAHEKEAMNITGNEPGWDEIAPHLDEALLQLPPADRHAIVLRFFERRDFRVVGQELGLSDDAAQKRVSRAVAKLRELLVRRGVTVSAAALAFGLGSDSLRATPAGLATKVSLAAVKASSATGGLTLLLLKIMASTKIKLAIGSAIVLALALTPSVVRKNLRKAEPAQSSISQPGVIGNDLPASAAAAQPSPATPKKTSASTTAQLRLTVLDAEDNKPVRSVQVFKGYAEALTATDREGLAEIPYRPDNNVVEFFLRKDRYADTRLVWEPKNGDTVPAEYTVRLSRAIKLSGQVLGPDGEVVQGARVGIGYAESVEARTRPVSHECGSIEAFSDGQGHWEITRVSQDMLHRIMASASHPDYVDSKTISLDQDREAASQLIDGTHIFRLNAAFDVNGIVVNSSGEPIADASVLAGHLSMTGSRTAKTGADGAFVIKGCKPGKSLLSAEASGYAASTISVIFTNNSAPFKLVLQAGKTLRLRVVSKFGKPIAGANVWLNTIPHGHDFDEPLVQTEFAPVTDQDGRVTWDNAPDKELGFDFAATGFARKDGVTMRPDGREHVVTLAPALSLLGTVQDAANGQPVPDFKLVCGWPMPGDPNGQILRRWSTIDRFTINFKNGVFHHVLEEEVCGGVSNCLVKIEADGYVPYISRVIQLDEGEVKFEVKLQAASEKTIKVVLPNGKPAIGATVALVTPDSRFYLVPGGFDRNGGAGTFLTVGDNGTVRFPADPALIRVIIVSATGYGEAQAQELDANSTIVLKPWGQISGVYKPTVDKRPIREFFLDFPDDTGRVSFSFSSYKVEMNSSGKFSWPKVPPGRFEIVPLVRYEGQSWSHIPSGVYVDVVSGQTSKVSLPGGYTVSARLILPPGIEKPTFAVVSTPRSQPPPEVIKDPSALQRWYQQPEMVAEARRARWYEMTRSQDNTWTAEGVPAGGNYVLESAILDPADASNPVLIRHLFDAKAPFSVPGEPTTGVIDLGEIELHPAE